MDTIQEIYQINRPFLKDGDLILFSGTGLTARTIRNCDNHAKHSHVGIIFEAHGALYIEDSNSNGVQADRLSHRIDSYNHDARFSIIRPLRPQDKIREAMHHLLMRPDRQNISYDYWNGGKELLNRKFGWKLKIASDDNRDICSDFVSTYAVELDMVIANFDVLDIAFPEDYVRYRDLDKTEIYSF